MTMLSIRVNGEERETLAGTLVELMHQLDLGETTAGVAVAVNGEIVPRSGWAEHALHSGDRVEVVGAVQGG